jgi:hypothetical protein
MAEPCVLKIGLLNVRIFSKQPDIETDVIDCIRDMYALFKSEKEPNLSVELEYASRSNLHNEILKLNKKNGIIRIKLRGEPPLDINVAKRSIKVRLFRNPEQRSKIVHFLSQFEIGIGLYILKKGLGFLLHSSSVVKDGKAIIFSGVSRTGKSFIREHFIKARGYMSMNDDCTLIQPTKKGCFCFTTPFGFRNYKPVSNAGEEVKAIYFLKAAPRNRLTQESQDFCAQSMIMQSFCAKTIILRDFISSELSIISNYIDLAKAASSSVDCFCWERNRRATYAEISRLLTQGMSKGLHSNRKI